MKVTSTCESQESYIIHPLIETSIPLTPHAPSSITPSSCKFLVLCCSEMYTLHFYAYSTCDHSPDSCLFCCSIPADCEYNNYNHELQKKD